MHFAIDSLSSRPSLLSCISTPFGRHPLPSFLSRPKESRQRNCPCLPEQSQFGLYLCSGCSVLLPTPRTSTSACARPLRPLVWPQGLHPTRGLLLLCREGGAGRTTGSGMTTCPGRPGTASTTRSWVSEEGWSDDVFIILEFAIFFGSKAPALSEGCALDRSLTWGGMEIRSGDLLARVRMRKIKDFGW
jgi:hypothetical protein